MRTVLVLVQRMSRCGSALVINNANTATIKPFVSSTTDRLTVAFNTLRVTLQTERCEVTVRVLEMNELLPPTLCCYSASVNVNRSIRKYQNERE